MHIQQLYTEGLAQAAYYIESDGQAALIDPLRNILPYLDLLAARKASLKYVFETHFHSDFVSGHLDLQVQTGAQIVYGPLAKADFPIHVAPDQALFKLGKISLQLWHTPGHTQESSCLLLLDENQQPQMLFSGDTLFIGDAGRPDLTASSTISKWQLAGDLFDSLQKIKTLPEKLIVYPGHGAGSACGKNMSQEKHDTLGNQKRTNWALSNPSKQAFISSITTGQPLAPYYFAENAKLNRQVCQPLNSILFRSLVPVSLSELQAFQKKIPSLCLLDTRSADIFSASHLPNSINIGLGTGFTYWVGTLIRDIKTPIILITADKKTKQAILELSNIGYENCLGYLAESEICLQAQRKNSQQSVTITAQELAKQLKEQAHLPIIDVRTSTEYAAAHIAQAVNKPLETLHLWAEELTPNQPYYIHCKAGYRSIAAVSLLEKQGIKAIDVSGGFAAIEKSGAFQLIKAVA